jgi:hypothetical protein
MSARESWTRRGGPRPERNEAAPGRTPAVPGPMNARCRCDRCGAHAYVRVVLSTRQDLLFCAHHYRQHAAALATSPSPSTTRPGGWPEMTGPAHGAEGHA